VARRLLPKTGAAHAAGFVDMFEQRKGSSQPPSNDKKGPYHAEIAKQSTLFFVVLGQGFQK